MWCTAVIWYTTLILTYTHKLVTKKICQHFFSSLLRKIIPYLTPCDTSSPAHLAMSSSNDDIVLSDDEEALPPPTPPLPAPQNDGALCIFFLSSSSSFSFLFLFLYVCLSQHWLPCPTYIRICCRCWSNVHSWHIHSRHLLCPNLPYLSSSQSLGLSFEF